MYKCNVTCVLIDNTGNLAVADTTRSNSCPDSVH